MERLDATNTKESSVMGYAYPRPLHLDAIQAGVQCQLPHVARLLLITLASWGKEEITVPAAVLQEETGLSTSAIRRSFRRLERLGLVQTASIWSHAGRTYTLRLPRYNFQERVRA